MSYNFVSQIKCLKKYNKLFAFFGLMPIFNFDRALIQNSKICKIYSSICAFCCTLFWVFGFAGRFQTVYQHLPVLELMLMVLMDNIDIFRLNYVILSTVFWNLNNWKRLLKNCLEVEEFLKIGKTFKWYTKVSLWMWMFNLSIFFSFSITLYFLFIQKSHIPPVFPFVILFFNHYAYFFEVLLIILILFNIKYKFKKIIKCLRLICNKQIQSNDNTFIVQIRDLSKMYRKIVTIVDLYNKIFGFQILCIITTSTLIMLIGLTFISLYEHDVKLEVVSLNSAEIFFRIASFFIFRKSF